MDDLEAKQEVLKFAPELKAARISSVSITYSGSGDEGQTEHPQFQDVYGAPIELPGGDKGVDVDALFPLLEHFVPEGYQDGDGGWGTITFNVETGKISVQHNWYETVCNPDEPRGI